jgi:DNA-binding NarL/FixJ family response regulator
MAPDIFVLVITNHDSEEYREAAYAAGADLFLSKKASTPFELAEAVNERIIKSF